VPVTVHIDELHSDIVATPEAGRAVPDDGKPEVPGAAEARWLETRCRAEWLARRVCAEAFDD
jgi:hypothetical protein